MRVYRTIGESLHDHFPLVFNRFSKFMWPFYDVLRLLKCKRMTISYLHLGVLEQNDMQKGGFRESRIINRNASQCMIHSK